MHLRRRGAERSGPLKRRDRRKRLRKRAQRLADRNAEETWTCSICGITSTNSDGWVINDDYVLCTKSTCDAEHTRRVLAGQSKGDQP